MPGRKLLLRRERNAWIQDEDGSVLLQWRGRWRPVPRRGERGRRDSFCTIGERTYAVEREERPSQGGWEHRWLDRSTSEVMVITRRERRLTGYSAEIVGRPGLTFIFPTTGFFFWFVWATMTCIDESGTPELYFRFPSYWRGLRGQVQIIRPGRDLSDELGLVAFDAGQWFADRFTPGGGG
jgi:hypothetical protein